MFKQRDIVLIPLPFTDLSSSKQRPVVVISNDDYNSKTEDIVVMAITSNIEHLAYELTISTANLEVGTLPRLSCIRADKVYTLAQSIVLKSFGRIDRKTFDQLLPLFGRLTRNDRPA
jgi:mRNA interferase MazF